MSHMEEAQQLVDRHFASSVKYWDKVYRERDLAATIYQRRKQQTLSWVAQLGLSSDSKIIDVGCGTGRTAVALAQMGFQVCALDHVPAMLDQARRCAAQAMVSEQVIPTLGNVSAMQFEDGTFDLTVALGLLPWVSDPDQALEEMLRVTKPEGYLILSSDNSYRLNYLLDPLEHPLAVPVRRRVARWLRRAQLLPSAIPLRMQSVARFRRLLSFHNLQILNETTIGFGPFTFFRQPVFSDQMGIKLHHILQSLADGRLPLLSAVGAHHIVLLKRSSSVTHDSPSGI